MTTYSPRIYVYKITFLEVPHYYYGAHLEKVFDEYYMGSPKTHKNYWDLYTPQKEIIKEFPLTDEGWLEALDYEDSLIKPVYNSDPLCLNEHCGGRISLEVLRESGRKTYELGIGCHSLSKEERTKVSKRTVQKQKELGIGLYGLTKEQRSETGKKLKELGLGIHGISKEEQTENAKKGAQKIKELGLGIYALIDEERIENGKKAYELGLGVHARTKEQMTKDGKKGGQITYELGLGIYALTDEERIEISKKAAKTTNSQVWECTVTGYRTNPGALSHYQKKRNIDTKNRIRIL